jgi:hypothetical protein
VRYLVHTCPPQHPIWSRINPVNILVPTVPQRPIPIIPSHLRPGIRGELFLSGVLIKFLCEFCISARHATCLIPSPLTWTNNPVTGLYREKYKLRSPLFWTFSNLLLLPLLDPDFVLRSVFCFLLVIWETKFYTHTEQVNTTWKRGLIVTGSSSWSWSALSQSSLYLWRHFSCVTFELRCEIPTVFMWCEHSASPVSTNIVTATLWAHFWSLWLGWFVFLLDKFKITLVKRPQYYVASWYEGVVVYSVLFSTLHVTYHFVIGRNWDILWSKPYAIIYLRFHCTVSYNETGSVIKGGKLISF